MFGVRDLSIVLNIVHKTILTEVNTVCMHGTEIHRNINSGPFTLLLFCFESLV